MKNITANTAYLETVEAKPGETVEFLLIVDSIGSLSRNVKLFDELPSGLQYVPFSTTIYDSAAPEGLTTVSGLLLGDLPLGQGKIVKFRANIATSTFFTAGTNVLTNTARLTADAFGEVRDPAQVIVIIQAPGGTVIPIPSPTPTPEGRVLGAAAVDTGVPKWMTVGFWSIVLAASMALWRSGHRVYWLRRLTFKITNREF